MEIVTLQYDIARAEIGDSMGTENEVVYIVDDDPMVRDALSSLLRANGKNVRVFTSGAEFLNFNETTLQRV